MVYTKTIIMLIILMLFVGFIIPIAIDRELRRMQIACEIDQARGYPIDKCDYFKWDRIR